MSYEIIWEPKGAIKRFFGDVTNIDLLESVEKIESDHRFDNLRYVINDFLACTTFSFDGSVVEDISVLDNGASVSNPDIKVAVVATAPDIVTATKQYAESPINAYETRIFSTLAESRLWLLKHCT